MRHWVMRTVIPPALLASLLVPLRADRAGAQTVRDQNVSIAVSIDASHDGRLVGGTQTAPVTRN